MDIARKTAPLTTCRCDCPYQCLNVELNAIQEYFQQFDAMNFNQQSTFLASIIEIVEPHRRRIAPLEASSFRRKITVIYSLKGKNGEKVRVCRNMVCHTFQVTRRRLQILVDKLKSGKDVSDQRGKYKRRWSACLDTEEIYIKEEIEGSQSEEDYPESNPIKSEKFEQYPKTNENSPEQHQMAEEAYIKEEVNSRSCDESESAPVISQIFEHYQESKSDSPQYQMPEEPHIKEEIETRSSEEFELRPNLTIRRLFAKYQDIHPNNALSHCSGGDQINPTIGDKERKRVKCGKWKDINNKRLRNSGECYISKAGKVIAKKEAPETGCTCSCNLQCTSFDLNEIQEYFQHFYTLCYDKQSEFLISLMELIEPRRRRVSDPGVSCRQITVLYMLPRNSGKSVRVCQKMICHTFRVTRRRIQMLIEKLKTGQAIYDQRGKHDHRTHRQQTT